MPRDIPRRFSYNFLQLFMCLSTFCLLEKCLLQPSHTSALLSSPSSCSVDDDNLLQIFMCLSTFCLFANSFLQPLDLFVLPFSSSCTLFTSLLKLSLLFRSFLQFPQTYFWTFTFLSSFFLDCTFSS